MDLAYVILLIVFFLVIGALLWLVHVHVPMSQTFRIVLDIGVGLVLLYWVLHFLFGVGVPRVEELH